MIPNQWYAVLSSSEVRRGRPVGAQRFGRRLVFWRDEDGNVACLDGTCCHRGADLAAGRVEGGHVHCPFHGLRYAADGRVVAIPANGLGAEVPENFRVRPWLAVDAFGFIWVFYGKPEDAPDDLPMFAEFRGGFPYAECSEVWDVHYSRAVENQLDVVHLPFVHPNTIGRGHKTLVNGPVTKWDDETLTFYVKNEPDRGQTPQKADEIENWQELNSLQYRVPNLWQNRIADDLRVMAAFAPIDDAHTNIPAPVPAHGARAHAARPCLCRRQRGERRDPAPGPQGGAHAASEEDRAADGGEPAARRRARHRVPLPPRRAQARRAASMTFDQFSGLCRARRA